MTDFDKNIFLPAYKPTPFWKKIIKLCYSCQTVHSKKVVRFLGIKFIIKRNARKSLSSHEQLTRELHNLQFQLFEMKNRTILFDDTRKKLNNFLLFKYHYLGLYPNCSVNLGDCVQTYCTQQAIQQVYDKVDFSYYDRDSLADYSGEQVLCVMQGWFAHRALFLPNNNILPVFVGTHITPSVKLDLIDFITHNPNYFNNKEIGCRDKRTQKLFDDLGIKSYFSRCLTLTLPKREDAPSQNKVFIVNIKPDYLKYIPNEILKDACFINQRALDMDSSFETYIHNTPEYLNFAPKLLERYKNEARLVITSAIHCAMPCLAMGIPVILINFEKNNSRFDVIEDVIKIYTAKELKQRKVDFNPVAPDIENLKSDILRNLFLSTEKARGNSVDENELAAVRERIAHFKLSE